MEPNNDLEVVKPEKQKLTKDYLKRQVESATAEINKSNQEITRLQTVVQQLIGVVSHSNHLLEVLDFGDEEKK
jgi:hypothetical protein